MNAPVTQNTPASNAAIAATGEAIGRLRNGSHETIHVPSLVARATYETADAVRENLEHTRRLRDFIPEAVGRIVSLLQMGLDNQKAIMESLHRIERRLDALEADE